VAWKLSPRSSMLRIPTERNIFAISRKKSEVKFGDITFLLDDR